MIYPVELLRKESSHALPGYVSVDLFCDGPKMTHAGCIYPSPEDRGESLLTLWPSVEEEPC